MKKLVFLFLFVMSFASFAQAEIIKFSQFSMNVPTGYTYEEDADGVYVSSPGENSLAVIMTFPATDGAPQVYAASFSAEFGGSMPQKVETGVAGAEVFIFQFEDEDFGTAQGMVSIADKQGIFVAFLGNDPKLIDMVGSME